MNTANPGPSGPPPTTAPTSTLTPMDELLQEIAIEESLDKAAAVSVPAANVRAQVLPLLANKRVKREELVELTARVRQLTERVKNTRSRLHEPDADVVTLQLECEQLDTELAEARVAMMATHREFAALCKATKREINMFLRDAKRNAEKLGLTKLAEFFRRLGTAYNSPDAAWRWENRKSAPATAGAN